MAADGSQNLLRLRFPDGDVEIRWTSARPGVGAILKSRGTLWLVRHSEEGAVTLEPAPLDDTVGHGGLHGPVVKSTPLGDEPLILETVVAA